MPDDNAITTYDPMMRIDVEAPSPSEEVLPEIKRCIESWALLMVNDLIMRPMSIEVMRERIRERLTSFQRAVINAILASANKAEKELDEIVFAPMNLRPPVQLLYPINTPLRRSIPRRKKTKKNV